MIKKVLLLLLCIILLGAELNKQTNKQKFLKAHERRTGDNIQCKTLASYIYTVSMCVMCHAIVYKCLASWKFVVEPAVAHLHKC